MIKYKSYKKIGDDANKNKQRMGLLTIEGFENVPIVKVSKGFLIEYIDIKACHNPFCGCGNFKMVCTNRQIIDSVAKPQSFSFEGNIFEESIAIYEDIELTDVENYKRVFDFLKEYLNEDDWDTIYAVFQVNKAMLISEFEIDEFDKYEYVFEEKHMDESNLRIQLNEIFPWTEMFVVEKEGTEYELVEQYCKSLYCECSLMNFNLFKKGGEYFDNFEYDYKTGEIYKEEYTWVIEQLTENDESLNIILETRHLKVRCLYAKALINLTSEKKLLTVENKIQQSTKTDQFKNVGRNEKCPCGSGEKFKKCCLKKLQVGS